ncbi:biotin/lipoyl-containing protein [Varibaculum massiliense]|uniref:biotin/lipoyl-containing protein n=1 Tax=Varibaculum massiliense TaxID=1852372 RepID=UPI0008D94920
MAQDIEMPALGESVTEGTVSRWLKKVGDQVAVDEPLLEVSTDKVDSEVPSPIAGVITEILVEEDETVDVGTVVCRVGAADEVGAAAPAAPAAPAAEETPAPAAAPAASPCGCPGGFPSSTGPGSQLGSGRRRTSRRDASSGRVGNRRYGFSLAKESWRPSSC